MVVFWDYLFVCLVWEDKGVKKGSQLSIFKVQKDILDTRETIKIEVHLEHYIHIIWSFLIKIKMNILVSRETD